jgi:hypothetical protein
MKNKQKLLDRHVHFEDSIELSKVLLNLSKDTSGHLHYYLVESSEHIESMWEAYSELVSFMNQVIDEQDKD